MASRTGDHPEHTHVEHLTGSSGGAVVWVREMVRNSPWIFMSIAVHVIAIAIFAVVKMASHDKPPEQAPTAIQMSKTEDTQELEPPPEVIDRKAIPKNEEAEVVTFDEDVFMPDTATDTPTGSEADLPDVGFTGGTSAGVGSGGHFGVAPSAFVSRKVGGRGKGGPGRATQGTEEAVLFGLTWLCRHQSPDGSWDPEVARERCLADRPCLGDKKEMLAKEFTVGLTGLSLLAFLGAGYNFDSKQYVTDRVTQQKYRFGDVVKRGLDYLKSQQKEDGSFHDPGQQYMYNEILGSFALSEAYGLSNNRYWKDPAQKAIDFLCSAQRPAPGGTGLWGWRYKPRKMIEDDRANFPDDATYQKELTDSDTSVTTWAMMALKSAKASKLHVPEENLAGAMKFIEAMTGQKGLVGYLKPEEAGVEVIGPKAGAFNYHIATMSALGMCARIFVETNLDDPFLTQAADVLVKDLPKVAKENNKSPVDYYYWYYGSMALNQIDGPDSPKKTGKYWGPWNKAMNDVLLSGQNRDEKTCAHGGWLDADQWSYEGGGPIYATAINVMTLEVYYRYENAFGAKKRGGASSKEEPNPTKK